MPLQWGSCGEKLTKLEKITFCPIDPRPPPHGPPQIWLGSAKNYFFYFLLFESRRA
jgi:hypothetical protein